MNVERYSTLHGDVQLLGKRQGTGPLTLIFAHGWISSRRMWDEVLQRLPQDLGAVSFDFRGCGQSDRPLQGHDLEGYAADLRAVIESVEGPVVIVAHSMGARVAQYVALAPQPHVRGLILVAPGVAAGTTVVARHRELTERAYGARRRITAFQRGAMVRDLAEPVMERIIEDALIAQREHWFGWYDVGRTFDFSDRLHEIALPVHVIAGESDPLIPLGRIQREVLDRISSATLTIIGCAGHNLAVEAPDELFLQIEDFLRHRISYASE